VPVTAGEVMDDAAVLLNDSSKQSYTYAKMLPLLKVTYREWALAKHMSGDQLLKDRSTAIDIAAGATTVTSAPSDMVLPIRLEERPDGSTGLYEDMEKTAWEPDETQVETLDVWNWREETIYLRGATTAREVRIYYWKDLAELVDENSNIVGIRARIPLSYKTAALAAGSIGGNMELATALRDVGEARQSETISVNVKSRQDLPVRRLPFRRR
tara:strand:+ start:9870 stop:10508 length:639 start_codon:yes stop_codon:yes gene_type:complete